MEKRTRNSFIGAGALFLLFIALIVIVRTVDVRPIGPNNSLVGLAVINKAIFDFLQTNLIWYQITNWLEYLSVAVALGFAVVGLIQLIQRKSIKKVDVSIILLGGIYLLTAVCYVIFEVVIVNYRPTLIEGELAASFPSSTVFTVAVILGTAMHQFNRLFQNKNLYRVLSITVLSLVIAVTTVGRMLSGVHWFTDILGALVLGGAIISLYYAFIRLFEKRQALKNPT